MGVAIAFNEVQWEQLSATDICSNYSLYSAVASTLASVELQNCEILVLGNAPTSTSDFVIGHWVMQHALDVDAVRQAIADTGQPIEQIVMSLPKLKLTRLALSSTIVTRCWMILISTILGWQEP